MKIGEKIKLLRLEKNLTQDELASRCELSKGFISQLERDLTSPSINTLVDILESLGTNLEEFFSEHEDEKVVFTKNDFFSKEDAELKYSLEWIVPNAQKNKMEPILLVLEPDGRFTEHTAHEGEEFGYVLSGTVNIHLGRKKYTARKGDSFSFKPSSDHYISNASKTVSKVLWVSCPPSF